MLTDDGVRVGEKVVADFGSRIDDNVGEQHGVCSDLGLVIDDDVGANVGIGANFYGGMNDCGGMYSGCVFGGLEKKLDGTGEGQVRIFGAQHGRRNGGEVVGHNDG